MSQITCQRYLLPGEYVTVRLPTRLGTLLGSCVGVCLLNPHRGAAAMNHFLLPTAPPDGAPGRFGDTATCRIIAEMMTIDPNPAHITARVYGGASVLHHVGMPGVIGARNIAVARAILHAHRIAIVGEDVGGTRGRRIDFDTVTGAVQCRLLGDEPGTRLPLVR